MHSRLPSRHRCSHTVTADCIQPCSNWHVGTAIGWGLTLCDHTVCKLSLGPLCNPLCCTMMAVFNSSATRAVIHRNCNGPDSSSSQDGVKAPASKPRAANEALLSQTSKRSKAQENHQQVSRQQKGLCHSSCYDLQHGTSPVLGCRTLLC